MRCHQFTNKQIKQFNIPEGVDGAHAELVRTPRGQSAQIGGVLAARIVHNGEVLLDRTPLVAPVRLRLDDVRQDRIAVVVAGHPRHLARRRAHPGALDAGGGARRPPHRHPIHHAHLIHRRLGNAPLGLEFRI